MARRAEKPLEPPTTEMNHLAFRVYIAMGRGFRVRVWDRGQPLEGVITRVERMPRQRRDGGAALMLYLGSSGIHLDDVTGLERA